MGGELEKGRARWMDSWNATITTDNNREILASRCCNTAKTTLNPDLPMYSLWAYGSRGWSWLRHNPRGLGYGGVLPSFRVRFWMVVIGMKTWSTQ